MSRAPWLFRAVLRLLPRRLRDAHGDDIESLFLEEIAAARLRGSVAVARIWLAALADVVRRAPREHWRQVHPSASETRVPSLISDLRFALRAFARQPGATALIIGTLGLAVAANTAVFALVDAVFFRSLPYPHASRLIDLNATAPKWGLEFTGVSYNDFKIWNRDARLFDGMALWEETAVNVSDGSSSERVDGQAVTYNLGTVLGIEPVVGRSFLREEDVPRGPNVVMIGYGLWQTRFGGLRSVIGKTIRIDSRPYTVVGVLPRNVTLSASTGFWIPLGVDANQTGDYYSYEGVARLKPGVTIEQARTDLLRVQESIWRDRDSTRTVTPRVMPLRDRLVSDYRTVGGALGAGVILVLAIACANVAGAMLARSVGRRRELAIRTALGASGKRLTRQLLTEALALATIAGILGTVLGRAGIGLVTLGAADIPPWLHLTIDARALAFSVLIVACTTLTFGLAPVLQVRRHGFADILAAGSTRSAGSLPERRLLNGLVVVEIALAAMVLASGGLLLRGYENLRQVDPGFRPDGVASFRVSLPSAKYATGLAQKHFYQTLIERVRRIPGVSDAGVVTCAPFTCHWPALYQPEGGGRGVSTGDDPVVLSRVASTGYFSAMGIRFVAGRPFGEHEGAPEGPRPTVVSDLFAARLWPGAPSVIGRRFTFRGDTNSRNMMTVVGVVRDVRHDGLTRPMQPGVYLPLTSVGSSLGFSRFTVVAHTSGDASALFAGLRAAVRALDPELPIFDVKTMRTAVNQSMAARRAIALWLASFAGIALTLAIGGIYAVLSYVVGRRRHEIGIRIALGARSGQVLALVVRQGLRLIAVGLIIGLPASWASSRLLSSLLVGVTGRDPATYISVVLVLVATGIVAAWIPARRAASVDPKLALSDGT